MMTNAPDPECTHPDHEGPRFTERNLLVSKRVIFEELDSTNGSRHLASRTIGRFCRRCLASDPDWNQEKFDTPTNRRLRNLKKEKGIHHG